MIKTFNILLILIPLMFLAVMADVQRQPSAKEWWQQGITAARNEKTDSALFCMRKAFATGITDDSLYYLWAEIFLYKGILDTALALNYSIPVSDEHHFFNKVLEQRYAIYTTLGWKKEAEALLDSLGRKPPGKWRHLIPECTVFLSGGAYYENNAADKNYPYPRSSDSTEKVINGNGIVSIRAGWRKAVGKTQGVRFGGKLRYAGSRFSVANSTAHLNDSADASFGAYLHYSLFSDKLLAGYTFNRKKDFLDTKSYLHQFFLRYAFLMKKWLGSIEAGYNYEAPVKEHFYYLMNYWDRIIDKDNSISFTLFLSGMTAETFSFSEDVVYIYVKDGVAWDSDFSQPLLTGLGFISSHANGVDYSIPQSHWAVNPHVRYEHRMSKRFSCGAGFGYNGNWYREKNSWIDFNYPEEEIPQVTGKGIDLQEKYLAYNYNDGNYYWVTNWETGIGQVAVELDSLPVLHEKRRVDQSLSLNLFFKSDFGKLGDVMADITVRRNFSSLMKSAPVDIQRWYGEMMLTWFFRFKPDYGP